MFLEPQQLDTVKEILQFYARGKEVWAFGSRVTGKNLKKFSDLDLVVMGNERFPIRQYARVKDAFTLSDLPFRVDVVDWTRVSSDFRKIIEQNYEVLQSGSDQIGLSG